MRSRVLLALLVSALFGCTSPAVQEIGLTCAEVVGTRDDGALVVEGDIRFASEQELDAFVAERLDAEVCEGDQPQLNAGTDGAVHATIPVEARHDITYCVSAELGADREAIVRAAERATSIWSSVIDVRFRLVDPPSCATRGVDARVVIIPYCERSNEVAVADYPYGSQRDRQALGVNVCNPLFTAYVASEHAMSRALLHEFGHILGFVHAWVTRDYIGSCACASAIPFLELSRFDADSIMGYEDCEATWSLFDPPALSPRDIEGAVSVYCAPGEGPPPCGAR